MTEPVVREREVAQRTISKARVLLEALPYMKEHSGKSVVVKLGGAAMADPGPAASFAEDVALLRLAGVRVVVVHGGGPQISELSARLGIETRFERGLRVTDAETLDVARMVLVGKINTEIVAAINRQGVPAAGVSGDDGALFIARKKEAADGAELGLVGDIVEVRPALLQDLMQRFVPVVASTATDGKGQGYNVNADEAAAALAVALGAEKLIFITDVPGLYESIDGGPEQLLSEVSLDECERLVAEGVVDGGMVPKVEAVLQAMKGGVHKAHILDGRVPHALILEMFTPEGLGTMITNEVEQ
ncbi:MAG: acetylglutamate kinase [Actinomycetota bacterium]